MGSLLPPVEDPQFAGWPAHRIDQLKSMARVRLDGREVFRSPGRFHEADPRTVDLGGNLIGMSSAGALFGGTIEHVSRLAMPTLTGGASSAVPFGPIRMRVTFPANH